MTKGELAQLNRRAEMAKKPLAVRMTSEQLLKHRSAYGKPLASPEEAFGEWLGPRRVDYGPVERCSDEALFYALPAAPPAPEPEPPPAAPVLEEAPVVAEPKKPVKPEKPKRGRQAPK